MNFKMLDNSKLYFNHLNLYKKVMIFGLNNKKILKVKNNYLLSF